MVIDSGRCAASAANFKLDDASCNRLGSDGTDTRSKRLRLTVALWRLVTGSLGVPIKLLIGWPESSTGFASATHGRA